MEIFLYGTDPTKADTDDDGIPDGWEIAYGLDPLDPLDAVGNLDDDTTDNLEEYLAGTNPNVMDNPGYAFDLDSDGDGESNKDEIDDNTGPKDSNDETSAIFPPKSVTPTPVAPGGVGPEWH